jgi:hypothetical protein
MPKYSVHVCRTAYSHLDIEVEAKNSKQAMRKAENKAGNHVFPTENTSEYEAQSWTRVDKPEKENKKYPRSDWHYEVKNGDTILGYKEWVEHRKESEKDDNREKD